MRLRPVGLLVGAAVATTAACGGSPAPLHPRDTSVSDNVEQAQLRGIESTFKANQRVAIKAAADAKAVQDAADAKAVQDAADAKAAAVPTPKATPKVVATPKATPKAIPAQPNCAAAAMARGKFDPNCSAYQGYLDPGTSAGRAPSSGDVQREQAKKRAGLPYDNNVINPPGVDFPSK
jgi:membrane protein involved in colicin uptake